jgi:hypothetical protein
MEEEKQQAPEEIEAMETSWEVAEGAADEEKFGATEDRAGELRLAMRGHRQRKKRAQVNGGPRQKFAAFRGLFTRRAVPALRKGGLWKGPGKKCRSGIRGRGITSRSGKRGRIVKRDQRLEAKRTHLEVTRKTLDLEIAMLIAGSYIGLRESGDGTLWKCRPPPKRKR